MTAHSFVDESKEPSYLLAAALIRPAHLAATRKTMSSLVLPRQRRIHFNNERDSRRSRIIARLAEMPIEALIFESRRSIAEKIARDDCLIALIQDHLGRDVRRLVIERDDTMVEFDRARIRDELRAAGAKDRMLYEHVPSFEEPLLAIADAVAWCWSRGGHWRVKAKGLVTSVIQA